MHVSFWKDLILTQGSGLPLSVEIDQRPDKKSRSWGPLRHWREWEPTGTFPPASGDRASCSSQGLRIGRARGRRRGGSAGFVGRGCSRACPALAADGLRPNYLICSFILSCTLGCVGSSRCPVGSLWMAPGCASVRKGLPASHRGGGTRLRS